MYNLFMLREIILISLVIELLTIGGRLYFGPMKERFRKMRFKYKARIHHGYIGVLLILFYLFIKSELLFITGMSLFLSDLIHHFVVLPLWIGRTEFP